MTYLYRIGDKVWYPNWQGERVDGEITYIDTGASGRTGSPHYRVEGLNGWALVIESIIRPINPLDVMAR